MSCLDWFCIHRPDFRFFRLDYPKPAIALVMSNQGVGRTRFDDGYAVAFALADVRSVSGRGDAWDIMLAS